RLAREVDLDQRGDRQLPRRRLRGERVAKLAQFAHERRLAALEVADEVPVERVAVDTVLRLEILCAVLADRLGAGLREPGQGVDRDVLRRCDDGDRRADLLANALVALTDLSRRHRRSL